MLCSKCGNSLPDDALFCYKCGADTGLAGQSPVEPVAYAAQPGGYPAQPGGYPAQPGGYPPQPGGYPPQPGSYPPQPGGYPAQPGGYPAQPGGYPAQPGGYPPQPGGTRSRGGYPQPGGYYPPRPGGYAGQQGAALSIPRDSVLPLFAGIVMLISALIGPIWSVVAPRIYSGVWAPIPVYILPFIIRILFVALVLSVAKKNYKLMVIPLALNFVLTVGLSLFMGFGFQSQWLAILVSLVVLLFFALTIGEVFKTNIPFVIVSIIGLIFNIFAFFSLFIRIIQELTASRLPGGIIFAIISGNISNCLVYFSYLLLALGLSKESRGQGIGYRV